MTELISTQNKLYMPQQGVAVHAGILYPNMWQPGTDLPIPFADLEHQFQTFEGLADALPFVFGDMLNYVELIYGESYAQISQATGMDTERLRQYKWVMGKFPPGRRYPMSRGAKYTHYRWLARIKDEAEQDKWLRLSYENAWSSSELLQYLNDGQPPASATIIPNKLTQGVTPQAAADWLIAMYDTEWLSEVIAILTGE